MQVNVETETDRNENWQRKTFGVDGHEFKVIIERVTGDMAYVEVWDAAGLNDRVEVSLDQAERIALKTIFNEVQSDKAMDDHVADNSDSVLA